MPEQLSLRVLYCRQMTGILRRQGSLATLQQVADGFSDQDRALLQEWCFGVCRWFQRLEGMATSLMEKPLRNRDQDIHCLILLGLYQLYFMYTPDYAVVNEAVATADELQKPWARNLVNAVLRAAQRNKEKLIAESSRDYSQWYSHPPWLLQQIKHDWPQSYRNILEANNVQAPMSLRVNSRKISREDYLGELAANGLSARAGKLAGSCVILDQSIPVSLLPGFTAGLVSVQDEASQLVSQILPVGRGQRVLDACAAPGGKTCALLEKYPDIDLLALDNEPRRVLKIEESLIRLELVAKAQCGDILAENVDKFGKFDCILLDSPCSGTGVIRRHPDIKLLRTEQDIDRLISKQADLLSAAWSLLKTGGYLLYSTCSILKSENEHQISRFMNAQPNARPVQFQVPDLDKAACELQLFPQPHSHDGFYYALLQKY